MGIIIRPHKIFDVQSILTWSGPSEKLFEIDWPDFDSTAHDGDADFAVSVKFEPHPDCRNTPDDVYVRPKNFEDAKNWVLDTSTITRVDKPRLLDLLNALEDDPSLFLHFAW